MKKVFLFFLISIFLLPLAVSAHQPRLIDQAIVVKVEEPQVSKAYFGEMTGTSVLYSFEITEPQDLYLQLMVPKIEGIDKDVSAYLFEMVDRQENIIARLRGKQHTWTEFYEEYTSDEYWEGPELTHPLEPGDYQLRIYSDDNQGKYILVVGQQELFPPKEILKMIVSMPALKAYFGKPVYDAYMNVLGLYLAGSLFALFIVFEIILKILKFIKKLFSKKDEEEEKPVKKLDSVAKVEDRETQKNIENNPPSQKLGRAGKPNKKQTKIAQKILIKKDQEDQNINTNSLGS